MFFERGWRPSRRTTPLLGKTSPFRKEPALSLPKGRVRGILHPLFFSPNLSLRAKRGNLYYVYIGNPIDIT